MRASSAFGTSSCVQVDLSWVAQACGGAGCNRSGSREEEGEEEEEEERSLMKDLRGTLEVESWVCFR